MNNEKKNFNCSMCGECCRHINRIPQLAAFDTGNGVCVHLRDNVCDIYDTRPEVCRIDLMYEKKYFKQFSKDEFYRLNEMSCKILQQSNDKL